jgi:hypothetical protein
MTRGYQMFEWTEERMILIEKLWLDGWTARFHMVLGELRGANVRPIAQARGRHNDRQSKYVPG